MISSSSYTIFKPRRVRTAFSNCIKDGKNIDPTCGSGSLLIRAADEAPNGITIYDQEYDTTTAGLAKMNLGLHNKSTGTIANANTLSNPKFKNGERIERFDFAVANPPFSYKSWANGIDTSSDERFIEYDATPPEKNGDYA